MSKRLCILLLLVALALTGCLAPRGSGSGTLAYTLPTTLNIALGEAIPGTDITYHEYTDQGARFIVQGQLALKRVGDSLRWSGEQVPGVEVELKLRVLHATSSNVRLVGTAKIVAKNTSPVNDTPNKDALIHYTGAVAYGVARGGTLPGTTLTYAGATDQGAQLSGLGEYPYRLGGDSIFWEGHLTGHVSLQLDVRVVTYTDQTLRVAGLATLWLE